MAIAEMSPDQLRAYYQRARDMRAKWEDWSAYASVTWIITVGFIPTLGAKPFAIMAVVMAFTLFRLSVWEREASKAAHELYNTPSKAGQGEEGRG